MADDREEILREAQAWRETAYQRATARYPER